LLKAIEDAGFVEPSEIQEKTIPLAIAGKDIIGGSATGSGKTLAFGASIIDHAVHGEGIQALIMTPTRELAEQVAMSLKKFSHYKKLFITSVYGGVSLVPQEEALERADIVVGTPGRLLDHLARGSLNLKNVKVLVLDEADRMLDMGFIDDVSKIIKYCPSERQTFLFSATISPDISHLAKKYMKNPEIVEVENMVDPSKLEQIYYDVDSSTKFSLLVHLLKNEEAGLVMVFCNTRHNTDFVAHNLELNGIDAIAIHGGLAQNKRSRIMEMFNSGRVCVLVCTDVAARGLDIKGVSHVYNYDAPKTSEEYVHRIGRTARAGKEGKAISIIAQRDYENFTRVLRNPELNVTQVDAPEVQPIRIEVNRRGGRGRGFGGRGRSFGGERRESRHDDSGEMHFTTRTDSNMGERRHGGESESHGERSYGGRGHRDLDGRRNGRRGRFRDGPRDSRGSRGRGRFGRGRGFGSQGRRF